MGTKYSQVLWLRLAPSGICSVLKDFGMTSRKKAETSLVLKVSREGRGGLGHPACCMPRLYAADLGPSVRYRTNEWVW